MFSQPDRRIHRFELGSFVINGKNFVVNRRRGVPYNAVIEMAGGSMRCWASREYLDDEASKYIREKAEYVPENNAFIWK